MSGTLVLAALATLSAPLAGVVAYITAQRVKRQELGNTDAARTSENVWRLLAEVQAANSRQASKIEELERKVEELWDHREKALSELAEEREKYRLLGIVSRIKDETIASLQRQLLARTS